MKPASTRRISVLPTQDILSVTDPPQLLGDIKRQGSAAEIPVNAELNLRC
jgi:hypothetical protein